MLRNVLIITTMCAFSSAVAADKSMAATESWLTVSYGDVTADIEETNTESSGWRLNLTFEKGPKGGNVLQGFVIGYIETTADIASTSVTPIAPTSYELKNIPIYYAPKYLFGKKAFKGFIKGALGIHFSKYQRTGGLGTIETNDTGLYAGASLGAMFMFTDKFFANVEYEWTYLSNSYYRDGELQSIMVGLGTKF